jgi:murein DD-endopeptidase MepM/ murein hydrolase activator NlpD
MVESVSYLGNQALSLHDMAAPATQYIASAPTFDASSTEDEGYIDDESELLLVSPTANAVRVQPGGEDEPLPSTRTQIETYVVEEGDTVGSIARSFGLRTETLLASNGLTVRSVIGIGKELKILPVDGISYKVKSGDTIAKLAKTYGSEAEKIIEMNGLAAGAALTIGQELILPDGRAPAPPAPAPTRIATNIKNIFVPPPSAEQSGSGKYIWPTAARRITQYYGNWRAGVRHTGVDIAGPSGTAIYAADDGVVAISGWNTGGYGNMIVVNHGGGMFTRYAHGSKLLVQAGDTVKKGDTIMLMGSTGRSTGPHLHFEVMVGTPLNRRNPFDYVKL